MYSLWFCAWCTEYRVTCLISVHKNTTCSCVFRSNFLSLHELKIHLENKALVFLFLIFFSLSREVFSNRVLLLWERSPSSSQYRWERITHLHSWVDWSNESKVPCSRKQQQQQLTELGIEPGTLQSPGQC